MLQAVLQNVLVNCLFAHTKKWNRNSTSVLLLVLLFPIYFPYLVVENRKVRKVIESMEGLILTDINEAKENIHFFDDNNFKSGHFIHYLSKL